MARLLVIDACLSRRLPAELKRRGRDSCSVASVTSQEDKDPELLPKLAAEFIGREWILVTSDDKMPEEHRVLIGELGTTIATIAP